MKNIIEKKLGLPYKYLPFGVAVINTNDDLIYINPFLAEIIGLNEIIFPQTNFCSFLPKETRNNYLNFKTNFVSGKGNKKSSIIIQIFANNQHYGQTHSFQLSLGEEDLEGKVKLVLFLIPLNQNEISPPLLNINEETDHSDNPISFNDYLSKDLLPKIWNHSDNLLFIFDKNGFVKYLNPAAEEKTGYTLSEVQIKENRIFIFEEKQKIKFNERTVDTAITDFQPLKNNVEYLEKRADILLVKKDGSKLSIALTVIKLSPDEGYREHCYLGIAEFIENEKILKQELFKQQELLTTQTRFISVASHELRTPLNIVLSSATLISKYLEVEQTDQIDLHVDRIVSSVQLITGLLNDFLTIRKIEENQIKTNICFFNIKGHITSIISELKYLLKEEQNLDYKHMGASCVNLDPVLLRHIVVNMISNAIKYSRSDGRIEILSINNNGNLELVFKDDGIGISETDQKHLFERFFRGSNALHTKGTGLGLNIVYNYIKLMKGNISVESELNKGTSFKIKF
ncbi:PAS/PAC sensor signal transduction histidine kinase [Pseudopedobacter saltans DSM 12145]|uniref:histidine kinase n=1 Tax=Pseudopedobacter saltans (strain ATCC 51119 / DSM 12145 / JCM 21818 / CCUG 39354 / LMG 10337 / NBRC 100064 / NCIMB 13643) TaxID=762903 RepID=F0S9M6_PSESL|nr:PAS domain-containing sensor histidine kinase [Pseudopedobacter saltans]ADY51382.1 PAS/PAC sensor signal transduction histidine kinase [Pseudopedobacter saltans DSM 12145]